MRSLLLKAVTGTMLILFLFLVINTFSVLATTSIKESKNATFFVHWYDVGKQALEELDGVLMVKNGWMDGKEINRVAYDPEKITVAKMEKALTTCGTYQGTHEDPDDEYSRPWPKQILSNHFPHNGK